MILEYLLKNNPAFAAVVLPVVVLDFQRSALRALPLEVLVLDLFQGFLLTAPCHTPDYGILAFKCFGKKALKNDGGTGDKPGVGKREYRVLGNHPAHMVLLGHPNDFIDEALDLRLMRDHDDLIHPKHLQDFPDLIELFC